MPTGGGKTLTSLAFALDHAAAHGLRRVIYVIPFTSVVEQTAAVFREVLGRDAVLEHHSAFDPGPRKRDPEDEEAVTGEERHRQAAENWDAPVVVTTAVQFFESLFAAGRGRCRKLHNIARSVVILDEAQTLPLPPAAALHRRHRRARAQLSNQHRADDGDPAGAECCRSERAGWRACASWHRPAWTLSRPSGGCASAILVPSTTPPWRRACSAERQALCIVNSRRHARELYEAIEREGGAFHLSTLMCAVHRRAVLETIRARLRAGLPVRLVSTSLIEAGVDISFPVVLRAEAGLDQIAQAAGRCNREGELGEELGQVTTFEAPDHKPPAEIEQRAAAGRTVLRGTLDPLSGAAVSRILQGALLSQGRAGGGRAADPGRHRRAHPQLRLPLRHGCRALPHDRGHHGPGHHSL